jgi:hypothetical protein
MLSGIAESYEEVLVTQSRHYFEVMLSSSQHEYDGWRLLSLRVAGRFAAIALRKYPIIPAQTLDNPDAQTGEVQHGDSGCRTSHHHG